MTQTKQPKTGSKFTLGPWEWVLEKRSKSWPGLYQAVKHEPLTFGWDGEEGIYLDNPVDARKLAAAPEMYELLSHTSTHDPKYVPCQHCVVEARRIKAEIDGEVTP